MFTIGYILAVAVGLSIGLLGGGGSILAVPILVYVFKVPVTSATAYSLLIVGLVAFSGIFRNIKTKTIDFKTGTIFAVPAFVGVYLTRLFIVPAVPEIIHITQNLSFSRQNLIMATLVVMMVAASISMIKKIKFRESDGGKMNYPLIAIEGLLVGALTGFVGAGGGFMIVPALVVLAKMPMKTAIGTSIYIIAIKSLVGFLGDITAHANIDWLFLAKFIGCSLSGMIVGTFLTEKISSERLKPAFGWFIIFLGGIIISREFF